MVDRRISIVATFDGNTLKAGLESAVEGLKGLAKEATKPIPAPKIPAPEIPKIPPVKIPPIPVPEIPVPEIPDNIRIGVTVDATAGKEQLQSLNQAVKAFDAAPARVGVQVDSAKLAATKAELEQLAKTSKVDIALKLNANDLKNGNLEKIKAEIDALRKNPNININIDVDTKGAVDEVGRLRDRAKGALQGVAQGVGQSIGANLGFAVASIPQQVIGNYLEFSDAIKQVGVVTQSIGTKEFDALSKEVERLGIVTSKSPAEIGNMAVSLSRAGFTAKESTSALEGIVRASEATGESLETVGDIIGKTLRTFGKSASESSAVSDALVQTANSTNTSISGLGESLKYIGPVAAGSNQSLDKTLVLIGLLGDQGIQGSMAGTNLAAALTRLKTSSAGASAALANGGKKGSKQVQAFQKLNAEVRNADGSMKDMLDILPILQNNLAQLSTPEKDLILKELFGEEGGRAVNALLNTSSERLATVSKEIMNAGGAGEKAGKDMLQGLGGALTLLEGSLAALSIKIGQAIAPALSIAANIGGAAINSILGVIDAVPEPIKQVGIAAVTAAAGVGALIAAQTAYSLVAGKAGVVIAALNLQQNAMIVAQRASLIANQAAAAGMAILNLAQTKVSISGLAAAAAQSGFSVASARSALATGAETAVTLASAAAKRVYAAATSQAAASALKLAGVFALVVAAGAVLKDLFTTFEGSQLAKDLDEAGKKLGDFKKELQDVKPKGGGADDDAFGLKKSLELLSKGNLLEAARSGLAGASAALAGGDAKDRLGNTGFATQEQLNAQQAQIALGESNNRVTESFQATKAILDQYGLSVKDASDKTRLGVEGLAAFRTAAEEQIKILDFQIQGMKNLKGATEEEQAQINAQVASLEKQKTILRDRIDFLLKNTEATNASAAAQQNFKTSLESTINAIQAAGDLKALSALSGQGEGQIKLGQSQAQLDALKQPPDQGVDDAARAAELAASEQRLQLKEAEQKRLQELQKEGKVTAEEFAKEEIRLQQEVAGATIELEQQKLQAKLDAIAESAEAQRAALESEKAELDLGGQDATIATNELSAQLELSQALSEQQELRAQIALDEAQAQGDVGAQIAATNQLFDVRQSALAQQQEVEAQIAEINNQQNAAKAEAASLQAQINELTAQEAVLKAQAEGKSEQEIGILSKKLELAKKSVAVAERGVQSQQRINELSNKTRGTKQETAQVRLANERQKAISSIEKSAAKSAEKASKDKEREEKKAAKAKEREEKKRASDQKKAAKAKEREEKASEKRIQKAAKDEKKSAEDAKRKQVEETKKKVERQAQALEAINQRVERSAQKFGQESEVAKGVSALKVTGADIRAREGSEIVGLVGQLKEVNLPKNVKQTIENQLKGLGFNPTGNAEQDATAAAQIKFQRETQLAEVKRKSLLLEQTIGRQTLEIEIKKQEIAAKTALVRAKGALAEAKASEDNDAIAAAQEGVALAKENVDFTASSADRQRQSLALQQQNTLAQFDAAENERRRASELELAKADKNFVGGLGPSRLPDTSIPAGLTDMAPNADLSMASSAGTDAIVAKLDEVVGAIKESIASPRQLTVVSKDPVSDAGKVYRDVAKGKARAAGL